MNFITSLSLVATVLALQAGCQKHGPDFDASGNFEADEIIVSAQQNGQILSFPVQEGEVLKAGATVGQLDVTTARLQQEQAQATVAALREQTASAAPQVELTRRQLAVQQAQLQQLLRERTRTQNLIRADAATQKQLDDLNAQITQAEAQLAVTRQQIRVAESNTATQNRAVLSHRAALSKTAAQFEEQVRKGQIVNPVTGTVLTKYAFAGEMATVGKPLYRIANTDTLTLRAYFTGTQLPLVKLGQPVTVRIDNGANGFKNYPGTITWISSKSEFTPKTIQTQDERANLVYAANIRVKNDGYLKIGMYGEVLLPGHATTH
ncbi:HlyD family efflux transporter periplasmic adaptor subunit [Hymenobacter sp. BT770]|uniref:HlyD family secretion protein n=1 Tax=Hymenobacter sp. BT770 TaxID=2886942 RepID=UPI001D102AD9|nr:HlyD family efflux transporter periplasmic adaptor subunit [Hymenobacter sp. BT770]MCC3155344.1 HlyD family efflux transporter periplasmic adaptor subunit [Hymenobacter sp. BT770]MDO3417377.1 HlyD family efflux transporter periplasmic adaptor subunit [Hymenobacter sp. BT770]